MRIMDDLLELQNVNSSEENIKLQRPQKKTKSKNRVSQIPWKQITADTETIQRWVIEAIHDWEMKENSKKAS